MKKSIHITIMVIFTLFALVQINDPDPVLWILIYGAVVMTAAIKLYSPRLNIRPLAITLVVIMSLFALSYITNFLTFLDQTDKSRVVGSMKAETPWIEGTRELGGLLLAILALVYMIRKS
ncbi:MAG: hypothetical protein ACJA2C_000764 [Marinoscillum sp.]|jgi:hypothetical protein